MQTSTPALGLLLASLTALAAGCAKDEANIIIYGSSGTTADTISVTKDSVGHDPIPCAIMVTLVPTSNTSVTDSTSQITTSGGFRVSAKKPC